MEWKLVVLNNVVKNVEVSTNGKLRFVGSSEEYDPVYKSTNGHLYEIFELEKPEHGRTLKMFKMDMVVAVTFMDIPPELYGKRLCMKHKNGDLTDNHIGNLEWVEEVEIWKPIEIDKSGFNSDGFYISNFGRVLSPRDEIIGCGSLNYQYKSIYLRHTNGKRHGFPVHILVAKAFLPRSEGRDCVNHIDGNPSNNYYLNLEFVTKAENNIHANITGLSGHKLDYMLEREIRKTLTEADGSPMKVVKSLAKCGIDVTETTVTTVKNKMIREGHQFRVKHYKKLTDDVSIVVRESLIRNEGSCTRVFNELHESFPDLTTSNIGTIKELMKSEGFKFIDGKRNIKIKEDERSMLIKLLYEYDLSPYKLYHHLQTIEGFKHVTPYDLKYLKRKYCRGL